MALARNSAWGSVALEGAFRRGREAILWSPGLFCKSATLNVAAQLPQKGLDPSARSGGESVALRRPGLGARPDLDMKRRKIYTNTAAIDEALARIYAGRAPDWGDGVCRKLVVGTRTFTLLHLVFTDLVRSKHQILTQRSERMRILRNLIHLGADVNAEDNWGATPLEDALVSCAEIEEMELLLQNGARLPPSFHFLSWERLAKAVASMKRFLAGVRLLVDRGVNLNVLDNEGFTALMWSARLCVSKPVDSMIPGAVGGIPGIGRFDVRTDRPWS